jgi:hypothetical protein
MFRNNIGKGVIDMAADVPSGQVNGTRNDLMPMFAALTNRIFNKLITCYSIYIM